MRWVPLSSTQFALAHAQWLHRALQDAEQGLPMVSIGLFSRYWNQAQFGAFVSMEPKLTLVPPREATPTSVLESIKRHVSAHCSDPTLSPRTVARAHGISVRQLHRVFLPTGETFGHHVPTARLAACRRSLLDSTHPRRPVADIAYACGFNSVPSFYRAFARRYGQSPRALRTMMSA